MEIPVSTPLKRFLAILATDSDRLAEYLHDRDGVIQKAGLSPEDVAALRSGDPSILAARFECDESVSAMSVENSIEPSFQIPTFTHMQKIDATFLIQAVAKISVVESSTRIATFTH